jgi:hypothetical protein
MRCREGLACNAASRLLKSPHCWMRNMAVASARSRCVLVDTVVSHCNYAILLYPTLEALPWLHSDNAPKGLLGSKHELSVRLSIPAARLAHSPDGHGVF